MTEEKKATSRIASGHDETPDAAPPQSPARRRTRSRMRELLVASGSLSLLACDRIGTSDPVPPPLRCSVDSSPDATALRVSSRAVWTQTDSGLVLRVELDINTDERDDALTFAGDPVLTDATLVHVDRQPGKLVFDCRPSSDATRVEIVIPLNCSAVATCFRVTLAPGQPEANRRVLLDWPRLRC
jgi:hypothetical protein